MAHRMRQADVMEVWATNRSRPLEALAKSTRLSEKARTGLIDGEIVCMFGVYRQNLMGARGTIWLLGTDLLQKHGRRFLRRNRDETDRLSNGFSLLENYCDARNTVAIRWLKWLGFTIDPPAPHGVYNLPFHHFHKEIA